MRKHTKRLSALFLVFALVCALGMTLAYFTDRVDASVTGPAGTLDLVLTESWTEAKDVKPGYSHDLSYTLANEGNKSADVRETFVITSNVPFSDLDADASATLYEFEIYNGDALIDANRVLGSYEADKNNDGANETYYTITYKPAEFVLNGSGDNAEIDAASDTVTHDYDLILSALTGNSFQGASITVDYLAEAKQHRNTDETVWTLVASESISFAGSATNVVPAVAAN